MIILFFHAANLPFSKLEIDKGPLVRIRAVAVSLFYNSLLVITEHTICLSGPGLLAPRVEMSSDPLASVHACWARVSKGGLYRFLFSDIEIVHAEKGKMVAKLKLGPHHLNSKGGLHGSTSATIVDW